ncbi:hypothetical protein N7495_003648 [Penicillium taxi]|uniref:uncharacterized protein n=1 Tax=Penicillium taxi TaxID=168475 RepID=UPI00254519FA|nr:uncharacterized protein N7495_003648 [Penicillium taxi]KAJ5898904.1 hypothetical protein N7495_003648 [Penicillium taxi]
MESMRSLNTGLPSSPRRPQPSEQLLQSFKAAALSVTQLYKTAALDQDKSKQAGYQEALEDLLKFLDDENLGVGDGEGWRIRQWATERYDGNSSLSSDEDVEIEKREHSSSPRGGHKEASQKETSQAPPSYLSRQPPTSIPATAPRSETLTPAEQPQEITVPTSTMFTFSAGPTFPQRQDLDMDMQGSENPPSATQDGAPVSVSFTPRISRHSRGRQNTRASSRESPAALGSKRKFNVTDFFDFSGTDKGLDPFGGGKRGRFT